MDFFRSVVSGARRGGRLLQSWTRGPCVRAGRGRRALHQGPQLASPQGPESYIHTCLPAVLVSREPRTSEVGRVPKRPSQCQSSSSSSNFYHFAVPAVAAAKASHRPRPPPSSYTASLFPRARQLVTQALPALRAQQLARRPTCRRSSTAARRKRRRGLTYSGTLIFNLHRRRRHALPVLRRSHGRGAALVMGDEASENVAPNSAPCPRATGAAGRARWARRVRSCQLLGHSGILLSAPFRVLV